MKLMVAFLLAFFVVFALWYNRYERKGRKQSLFLVTSLILFAAYLLLSDSISGDEQAPAAFRLFLSNLSVMLFMPCAYLYSRSMITGRNISRRDWLHVLPVCVFLANAFLQFDVRSIGISGTGQTAGFLTFAHFVVLGYLFLQMQILVPQIREICQPLTRNFYPALRWILLLGAAQSYFIWYRVASLGNPESAENLWLQIPVLFECFVIVGIYVIHLAGRYLSVGNETMDDTQLEHVEILDQFDSNSVKDDPLLPIAEEAPARIEFQDFQFRQIEEKIKAAIAGEKQFLRTGYTIRMLSDETGISAHLLSAFINRRYGINFNDFINEYRIHYCIEKIRNDEWRYKTLEALSRESGFNNRNSFTLSFKKVVGLTPSGFLKTLKV